MQAVERDREAEKQRDREIERQRKNKRENEIKKLEKQPKWNKWIYKKR